jgi:hypothetical protein
MIENSPEMDDLEQIASRGDPVLLKEYLKSRKILIPRRPRRFLEAAKFTQEELMEQIRQDAQDSKTTPFEPWILEVDGKKRLPAFSSRKKMQHFAARISMDLNKVFSLLGGEVLLAEIAKNVDANFVDLNLFSERSWEIDIRQARDAAK